MIIECVQQVTIKTNAAFLLKCQYFLLHRRARLYFVAITQRRQSVLRSGGCGSEWKYVRFVQKKIETFSQFSKTLRFLRLKFMTTFKVIDSKMSFYVQNDKKIRPHDSTTPTPKSGVATPNLPGLTPLLLHAFLTCVVLRNSHYKSLRIGLPFVSVLTSWNKWVSN